MKEIVRLQSYRLVPNVDFILIVRKSAVGMKTKELERSVFHVLKKAGLLKPR